MRRVSFASGFHLPGLRSGLAASIRLAMLAMFLVSVGLITRAVAQTASKPAAGITALRPMRIVIGAVLKVEVEGEPQLCGAFTVSGTGSLHLTLADDHGGRKVPLDVPVNGATTDEAAAAITARLKPYLRVPITTVSIADTPHINVELSGAVKRLGRLSLPIGSHLADALAAAECQPEADFSRILLLRTSLPDQASTTTVVDLAGSGTATEDALRSGDRIIVMARSAIRAPSVLATARVVGEVGKEGDVPVGPDTHVRDLLTQVGGLKDTADTHNLRLHRSETSTDYVLDASRFDSDPKQNLVIRPGDYLVVDHRDRSLRFAVAGEVVAPLVHDSDAASRTTVKKAILQAGGPSRRADLHHGLLRQGYLLDPTHSRDLPFDYAQIARGKANDMEVQPGDLVVLLPRKRQPTLWQRLLPIALHFLPLGL